MLRFQSQSGVNVGSVFNLVEFHLRSTVTNIHGKLFLQKSGICIGSRISPVLSELYLRIIDLSLADLLTQFSASVVLTGRYGDDILVCTLDSAFGELVKVWFLQAAPELTFSVEEAQGGRLQCLGIRFFVQNDLCWNFMERRILSPFRLGLNVIRNF